MSLLSGLRMLNKQEITFGEKKKVAYGNIADCMTLYFGDVLKRTA